MTSTYNERAEQHEAAVGVVKAMLRWLGFKVTDWGLAPEHQSKVEHIRHKTDPEALKQRFKPNLRIEGCGTDPFLVNVTSKNNNYHCFSVEVDAYTGERMWETSYRVAHFYVDLGDKTILAAWSHATPAPAKIKVPRRFELESVRKRLSQLYPNAEFEQVDYRGAGTPCYWISKNNKLLVTPYQFLKRLDEA